MREDLYRMKQLQQHADTKTATVRIVFVVFRHSNKPAPISVQWHDLKERNKNAKKNSARQHLQFSTVSGSPSLS